MIPPEKIAAVNRGLLAAFGTTHLEDIRRMTRGLSSDLVFRIVVEGSPYLLRVMTRMDERLDPGRIFTCMSAAAEADLTPCVRYSHIEDGVSITDFVEAMPFSATQALVLVPLALRKLHALPPFPKVFNYVTAHNSFIWKFRNADLLSREQVDEAFAHYQQLCGVYPRLDSDMVSCHCDLKPENILFDGRRVWLVDWQAAFVNDRYFDLAVVANFVVDGDADERIYLERYFGQPPDEYRRARFFLMRQVLDMFYGAVFLLLGSGGQPIEPSAPPPSFSEFHRRIWAGEIDLADNHLKILYGTIHWQQFLRNVPGTRFAQALEIVSERDANRQGPLLPGAA